MDDRPTPEWVLTLRQVDPYYVWAVATRFEGMPPARDMVPLLVELVPVAASMNLRALLGLEFDRKEVVVPEVTFQIPQFTIYAAKRVVHKVIGFLSDKGARWELGLPFASPSRFLPKDWPPPGHQPIARPRSDTQVVGIIDYGCAFAHRQLRAWQQVDGQWKRGQGTRVLSLWDQGGTWENRFPAAEAGFHPPRWDVPVDFDYGVEWQKDGVPDGTGAGKPAVGMNAYVRQFAHGEAIDEQACYALSGYKAIHAAVTHGCHVTDVAAGFPDPLLPPDQDPGKPLTHDIVFVDLPRYFSTKPVSGLLRTYVLDAVHYVFSCAKPEVPVTINLSYGAYAGPHDGSSILERALDAAILARRQPATGGKGGATDILIAAGNGADQEAHVEVPIPPGKDVELCWSNIPDNPTDQFIEIWFDDGAAGCEVRFAPPGGAGGGKWVAAGDLDLVEVSGKPVWAVIAPKQVSQSQDRRMVLIAVGPTGGNTLRPLAPFGDWTLAIRNKGARAATVKAWIERNDPVFGSAAGPRQARFRRTVVEGKQVVTAYETLNNVASGSQTIVVGGYVGDSGRVPLYSGKAQQVCQQGQLKPPQAANGKQRPEVLAICEEGEDLPGVAAACVVGSERVRLPGTSVACAVATRYVAAKRLDQPTDGPVELPPPEGEGETELPRVPRPGKRGPDAGTSPMDATAPRRLD